jgi:predicted HicB family RNase H-like nuclease
MSNLKIGRPSRKEKAIAAVQDTQISTVRMNVNIQKELHRQLKQRALDENISVTDLVKKALHAYLSK